MFSGLKTGLYALKVHAYNRRVDVATVKRGFVMTSDPTYCSAVLVNRGVTHSEDGGVVVEFQLYGPATHVLCSLDGGVDGVMRRYLCFNPSRAQKYNIIHIQSVAQNRDFSVCYYSASPSYLTV